MLLKELNNTYVESKMEKLNKIEGSTEDSLKEAQKSFEIAQEVLKRVKGINKEMKNDLKAEREGKPKNVNKIKLKIRRKQHKLNQIQRRILTLKKKSKNHKTAISQWEQWYESLADEDKDAGREKLMSEINRRAAGIKKIEWKIGKTLPIEYKIKDKIDILNYKLKIFEQDKFEGSVDKDPRLLDITKRQKKARDSLESARVKLENLKKEKGGK